MARLGNEENGIEGECMLARGSIFAAVVALAAIGCAPQAISTTDVGGYGPPRSPGRR